MGRLNNKVAIITGGSRGMGEKHVLAIALVFAGGVIVTVNETALSNSLPINEISSILLSMALYCIVYVIGIVESYVILLKSEERMVKVYMRLRRKIRKKLDD